MINTEMRGGLIMRDPRKTLLVEGIVNSMVKIHVDGEENYTRVEELLAEGHGVSEVSNHASMGDAPLNVLAKKQSGHRRLSRREAFILGVRLMNGSTTNFLSDAYNHVPIYPQVLDAETNEERSFAMRLAKESIPGVEKVREQQRVLVLYPEGTRSATGEMARGNATASHYIKPGRGRDTYVLPVAVEGAFEFYPRQREKVPYIRIPRWDIYVRVGEPINMTEVAEELKGDGEIKQKMVDRVMQPVADLLPERMRGFYRNSVLR